MVQFLPMPAIAFPQNAMINFSPMNQSLQFMAQNNMDRARFGLQQNADLREQDMHPLRMDQTRAQTAGLVGQENRAQERQPYELRHLTAQTGLVNTQSMTARNADRRAQDLHGPALGMANLNLGNATLDRDQRIASLLAMATTPEQHQMVVNAMRSRRIPIPAGLDTWQGASQGAANIAGPAFTQAQMDQERLRRLNPLNDVDDRQAMAARLGWDPSRPPTPFQMYGLTGQIPRPQPISPQAMQFINEADNAIVAGSDAISMLNQALNLSAQAYSGMGAPARGRIADTIGMARGTSTVVMDTLLGRQAVGQLRALFGGNPTEGERAILMQLEGSSSMSREARERLIQESISAARQRIAFNQMRATAMRNGEYFAPTFNPQTNYAAMLAQQGRGGETPAPAGAGGAPAPAGGSAAGPRDHGAVSRDSLRGMATRMSVGDTFTLDGRRWRVTGPNQFSQVQ